MVTTLETPPEVKWNFIDDLIIKMDHETVFDYSLFIEGATDMEMSVAHSCYGVCVTYGVVTASGQKMTLRNHRSFSWDSSGFHGYQRVYSSSGSSSAEIMEW